MSATEGPQRKLGPFFMTRFHDPKFVTTNRQASLRAEGLIRGEPGFFESPVCKKHNHLIDLFAFMTDRSTSDLLAVRQSVARLRHAPVVRRRFSGALHNKSADGIQLSTGR
jgi:hypothetical protein